MSATLVQILDYGSGNLFSISDSLSRVSPELKVKISSTYSGRNIDGLVLPGVGSFSSAQRILEENREDILRDLQEKKMPLLGICLGMQLMFQKSEEGQGRGLALFKGDVVRFRTEANLKIPHMGWNIVNLRRKSKDFRFCKSLKDEEWAYFVHSYYPKPEDEQIVRAWTKYGTQKFPSLVERENIFGTQFHPEKSSTAGFKLISNFAKSAISYSKKKK
ncbi:MAG: imidazole glycerol phosphate synthase subunit HisH [Nitrososphaerales archaeon]